MSERGDKKFQGGSTMDDVANSLYSTYHHFFTRAAEHMGISNLTGKHLKCVKQ